MQKTLKKLTALILLLCVFLTGCTFSYNQNYYTIFSSLYMSVNYCKGSDDGIKSIADDLDAKINPDNPTSFVSIFNEMDIGELQVDKQVYDLVSLSLDLYEKTSGAFDITLSSLSKAWSVDHNSLEQYSPSLFPSLPSYESLNSYSSTMQSISVREQDGKYYLSKTNANAKIDLGGIAKGYLADLVSARLTQNGVQSAIVDISGNLYLLGNKIEKNGSLADWKVGVNDCFNSGVGYLCGIVCQPSVAVVTSGTYERGYEKDGVKVNHIINPFTRMPVGVEYDNGYTNSTSSVVSATVIGSNSALCDAIATAICVLGLQDGKALAQRENLNALIVTSDGKYTVVGDIEFMNGDFYLNEMERV